MATTDEPNQQIKDKFAINYYKWADQCFAHEIESDFSLLRQFECTSVAWFLKMMSHLDERSKYLLAKCLLKRGHPYAVAILNEKITHEEQKLTDWYIQRGRRGFETGERRKGAPIAKGSALPRNEIRKKVTAFFGGRLGRRVRCETPNYLAFDFQLPNAIGRTIISLNGEKGDLHYLSRAFDIGWAAN